MIQWDEGQPPRDLAELWTRVSRMVRSLKDVTFRDGIALTGAAAGELVAHGQLSRPRRCVAQLAASTSGTPVLKVGEINETHVRLFASGPAVVDLAFWM